MISGNFERKRFSTILRPESTHSQIAKKKKITCSQTSSTIWVFTDIYQ